MASIYKPTGRKVYRIEFKGEHSQPRTVPGYRDRGASRSLAAKLESDAGRLRAGEPLQYPDITGPYFNLGPTSAPAWVQAAADYLGDLIRQGSGPGGRHYRDVKLQLARIARECTRTELKHIAAKPFTNLLDTLTSPRSKNKYHQCPTAFVIWCKRQNYLRDNPIQCVPRVKQRKGAGKRRRRAYTPEEAAMLLAATPAPRRTVYAIALTSGLRRQELRRIQKRDLSPEGPKPRWHLRPEVSLKNKIAWNLAMLPECAKLILPYWQQAEEPTSHLFFVAHGPGKLRAGVLAVPKIGTLYADLKHAKIVRIDSRGRHADFHSFRYTFCKRLAERLPIQTVKTLMRHLTLKMTADLYGELEIEDLADVWSLHNILPSGPAGGPEA